MMRFKDIYEKTNNKLEKFFYRLKIRKNRFVFFNKKKFIYYLNRKWTKIQK